MSADESRMERIETQCAFQEELLASLDRVLSGHSRQIAALEQELAGLRSSLAGLREGDGADRADEPPPPHY